MFWTIIFACFFTALLSSVLTLTGAYVVYRKYLREILHDELEDLASLFQERLEEGFRQAGTELLPEFRREVSEGFKDAMVSAAGGGLVDKTAKRAAKTSVSFIQAGLNAIFGETNQDRDKKET